MESGGESWAKAFVGRLARLRGPNVFNPYSDVCPTYDLSDAPAIRAENLRNLLSAAADGVDAIWFGQELGHKGGRRTGIALSDETRLHVWTQLFGVQLRRATHGRPFREHTAGYVAQALTASGDKRVFGWNAYPLHCHQIGNAASNRGHDQAEREAGAPFVRELVEHLRPTHIVAIGQSAEALLRELALGPPVVAVRHPSNGGAADFFRQITAATSRAAGPRI